MEFEKKVYQEDYLNLIESKLRNSFQLVKKDIDSLKSLNVEVKKISNDLQKIKESVESFSSSKDKKTIENNDEKLQRNLTELKELLEKERKNFEIIKEKQKAKYLSKISYLKAKINEYKKLEKLKEEIDSSIEKINIFLANLESQRKKDFERFFKEKNEVMKFYESELKKIMENNRAFQNDVLNRVSLIEEKIENSLKEFNKNIEKILQRNYEKLREENISTINEVFYKKKKVPEKKDKNIFSKLVDDLSDESGRKSNMEKKENKKRGFIDKIVDQLSD